MNRLTDEEIVRITANIANIG